MRSTRFRTALLTFLLALFVPISVQAADDAAVNDGAEAPKVVVTLLEAGAEPRTELRFKPEKGAKEETEMSMRMKMQQSMNGMEMPPTQMPAMRIVLSTEVEEVKENGDIVYAATTTRTDVRDEPGVNPMMRRQISEMLRSMEGLVVRATISNRGIPRAADMELPAGVDPMMRQQMEGMMGSLDQFAAPVPEEAVGAGARWRVESTLTQQGMTMKQTATYTLKSINDGKIELDVEFAQNADPQDLENPMMPPGMTSRLESLDGKGTGATMLRLDNVMPHEARVQTATDFEMSMSMGGQSQNMKQRMEMDMRLSVAEPEDNDDGNGDS